MTVDYVEDLRTHLRQAAAERGPVCRSLRDVVACLVRDLDEVRAVGWGYDAIAEGFTKRGLPISPGTLARYHRDARRNRPRVRVPAGRRVVS